MGIMSNTKAQRADFTCIGCRRFGRKLTAGKCKFCLDREALRERGQKRCGKCKVIRGVGEFYPERSHYTWDGLSSRCKVCTKERGKLQAGIILASPELRQKRMAYLRGYRDTVWGKAKSTYSQKRNWCKRNGVEFSLTPDWIAAKLHSGVCELTGIRFNSISWHKHDGKGIDPYMFSLDRRNPNRGYTKRNTRAVLYAVNIAKREWSDNVLKHWAAALIAHSGSGAHAV